MQMLLLLLDLLLLGLLQHLHLLPSPRHRRRD